MGKIYVPESYFDSAVNILFIFGFGVKDIKNPCLNFAYSLYRWFMIFFIIYGFVTGEIITGCIYNYTIDSLTFNLQYNGYASLCAIKITWFVLYRKDINNVINILQSGIFKPDLKRCGSMEFKLIKNAISSTKFQTYVMVVLGVLVIAGRAVNAQLDKGMDYTHFNKVKNITETVYYRKVVCMVFHPEDLEYTPYFKKGYVHRFYSDIFYYRIIYECIAGTVYFASIACIDAILCTFMKHINIQLLIVKCSIKNIVERAKKQFKDTRKNDRIFKDTAVLSKEMNDEVEILTIKVMRHHQEIVKLCEFIENLICRIMFFQFGFSLFIICCVFYQLSITSIKSESTNLINYLFLILFQLLVFCVNGDDVIATSLSLSETIFAVNWYTFSNKVKKYWAFMMMRSQKPLIFTTGKFATLSIQTYMAILRKSYSFFMVLNEVNDTE